jgi:Ala-tRNA(Pro) deacylase
MMSKQEIYDFLKKKSIRHEVTEHGAVFSMDELDAVDMPHRDRLAKNIFVRDDRKENHYLITVRGERRVDLKEFRTTFGLRHLSFAPEEDLTALLGVHPGSVSPFGLLNDSGHKVRFFADRRFLEGDGLIGIHPNDNTATVWMNVNDLLIVIREHGNEVTLIG